ncbi:MAG: winged helix-turn-helix domain-containing protein, partial [Gammaproteobacteria bacterium]
MAEVTDQSKSPIVDPLRKGFRLKGFQVLPDKRWIVPPDGEPIDVEAKVMGVLEELAHAPGQVLSVDHFMDTVWKDRVVEPGVLHRAITELRKALGDPARSPEFIKTYPTRGYELIVEVEPLEEPKTTSRPVKPTIMAWIAAAVALVLIVVGLTTWLMGTTGAPTKVAVIPFTAPDDPALPMGGEGIADYLISALTDSGDLSVVSRRDSFALLGTTMDVETIGDELDADYLVNGSIALNGDALLLTLSLTDTDTEADIWTKVIDGRVDELATLQSAALGALSEALVSKLHTAPLAASASQHSIEDEAYRKYLEAQYQWHLRGQDRINRAIQLLREAIALRPDFAEGHMALASSLAVKPFYGPDPVAPYFREAREELGRVTEITDELNSEVHALKGMMFMEEGQWATSRDHLLLALEQKPDNALARYWMSQLLSRFGDYTKALEHAQRAAELDPLSAVINDRLALAYLWVNDTESAENQYKIAYRLGYLEGTQVQPVALLAYRLEDWDGIRQLLLRVGYRQDWVEAFVRGLAEPDYRQDAAAIIEAAMRDGVVPRDYWFGIWVLLKDKERALRDFWVHEKSQNYELMWASDAEFLRSDPRFA